MHIIVNMIAIAKWTKQFSIEEYNIEMVANISNIKWAKNQNKNKNETKNKYKMGENENENEKQSQITERRRKGQK